MSVYSLCWGDAVMLFERLSLLIAAITLVGTACLIVEMRRF